MSRVAGGVVLASLFLVAVIGASRARHPSAPPTHAVSGDCAACHEGRVSPSHTAEFVRETHGLAARAARTECLGCHEAPACDRCHIEAAPPWHSEAFRHPARGPLERTEHARVAALRQAACLECHGPRFLRQCAGCHRPTEEWARP